MNAFKFLPLIFALFLTVKLSAQVMDRSEIEEKYKWKLEDIYESDEAWRTAKEKFSKKLPQLGEYKGKLGSSAETLLQFLSLDSDLTKTYFRLYAYASMKSDQDTRDATYIAMNQEMGQLGTKFSSVISYAEPEILKLSKEKIEGFISEEKGLTTFEPYLSNLLRQKKHTLSEKEEKLLAEAGSIASSPENIFKVFSYGELPYPTIKLSDGSEVTLNNAGYAKHRANENRADRELVFQEFWNTMSKFKNTLAEQLYSNIKTDVFYTRARGYETALHRALDNFNIPTEVYHSLVDNVNTNLDAFHRYLSIKKRMLGVDTLKYSDMYAPVVEDVDLEYTYEEAQGLILESLQPLGKDYTNVIQQAFDERWIDVYPSAGKTSGAYSNGIVYDVHPYILLNYNEQYNDVSTLAHELGHTMHSYLSNKNQHFVNARYSIFVAEVASTLNEALLMDKVLNEVDDEDTKLSLLMEYLDGFKGTLFRQTQFAEFELRMHEKVEAGEPLTSDVLSNMYGEILKKYYGHDKNVTYIEDLYSMEWSYIPHFYYNYYVYQYSTSYTASTALAEKILAGDEEAKEKYIKFLSSGKTKYPIELLKDAGVDMTTDEPFNKTMHTMNKIMDEVEKILDKKGM
jgi:oligoendopeptidase F